MYNVSTARVFKKIFKCFFEVAFPLTPHKYCNIFVLQIQEQNTSRSEAKEHVGVEGNHEVCYSSSLFFSRVDRRGNGLGAAAVVADEGTQQLFGIIIIIVIVFAHGCFQW